jgi:phosphate transport system substrate-binding protein
MVTTKGIKVFLHDVKAVSPAIATLILIVIAAVAAAGVGILVQSSQKNAQDQTGKQDLSAMGTLDIQGSTTVLPITQMAIPVFAKRYPGITINTVGGGSDIGQWFAYTTTNPTEDIGASSSAWSTSTKTINGVLIPTRANAIMQEGGSGKVWESKIGTGMIVLAGQNQMAINNSSTCTIGLSTSSNICFVDLKEAYSNGTNQNTIRGTSYTVIQRSDKSGTEETFAKWIDLINAADGQLNSTAVGYQGNQGIREAIAANPNLVGFVDIGFTGSNVNGNTKVKAATFNTTAADATTKGVGGPYDLETKKGSSNNNNNGLARDLYYYTTGVPTGAASAYLNWIMTPDGQAVVQAAGFFSI